MKKPVVLPPLISKIQNGEISWRALADVDTDLVGYFLSCHSMIEHYLDQTLKEHYSTLDWDAARLTFQQKISLIATDLEIDEHCAFNIHPAAKHMNALRNKLAHNVEFRITARDLTPLVNYLKDILKKDGSAEFPKKPKDILHMFTMYVCSFLTFRLQIAQPRVKKHG